MLISDGRKFPTTYNMTCGVDVHSKRIHLHNSEDEVGIIVLDSAGSDLYKTFLSQYWNQAHLLLVMFDVTNEDSFSNLESWVYLALESSWGSNGGPPIACALYGNKTDLAGRRMIERREGEELADKLDMPYFEGSAKEYEGVDTVIQYLSKEWSTNKHQKHKKPPLSKAIFNKTQPCAVTQETVFIKTPDLLSKFY
uniref:Intraflagellar transport protein 27 homolog n=1 Tax=Cacopsylla melanoneura TaxID=428564 RepID=A0A8D8QC45_9HEMI